MSSNFASSAKDVIDKIDPNLPDNIKADGAQIDNILETIFIFAGFVALVYIVIGGFRYVISSGDPQKTAQAKETVLYAVIGLIVALMAFTIVRFVLGNVEG